MRKPVEALKLVNEVINKKKTAATGYADFVLRIKLFSNIHRKLFEFRAEIEQVSKSVVIYGLFVSKEEVY